MTDLENEIAALRKQMDDLADRVRLDAVAKEFLAQEVVYREGDVFRFVNAYTGPEVLHTIALPDQTGKPYVRWGISNWHSSYETEAPDPARIERLYSHAEVAEIVAKVSADVAAKQARLEELLQALRGISCSTNPDYMAKRAREALGPK